MVVPKEEFESITKILQQKFTAPQFGCEFQNNICSFNMTCKEVSAKLQPLSIQFGDEWYFNIPSADLLYSPTPDNQTCILGIQGGDSTLNTFVIGDTFLRSFISVYDYENKQVGLVLHKNSRAYVNNPNQPEEKGGMSGWLIFLIVLVVLAVLAVAGYLGYKAYKKKIAGGLS